LPAIVFSLIYYNNDSRRCHRKGKVQQRVLSSAYMAQHYIMLMRFTDKGIRNIKDTTKRADAARSEAERIGGKITIYWTFGKYDGVGILEAPNDEAALEFGLRVGSLGNIRTATLKAFTEEEIARVMDKLS
jgi:uncharacterized protein with GYD domain